ncbi:MAG TPA: nitroreductase family deazaflavin-dependent oxidoreductase [Ktedonobacteraceae bacterium]|jgi:deazaflavin-dependent oxidoreductase (nitroreductase family)|nr:nitroreductase family deazaflavin-dependent oxidoreductase [Ktedonobacteraceae bacterium]
MPNDFNQSIIDQFRANGGKVGAPFADRRLLLLNTIGAKSGQPRLIPLAYTTDGDRIIIIASKAGAPTNPDWYYNLLAHPLVTVELGHERFEARATVASDQDHDRLYDLMVAENAGFDEYRRKTTRQIPVVILERVA